MTVPSHPVDPGRRTDATLAEGGPQWLDELGLDADGPPWLAMGLSRLDEDRWLDVDDQRAIELAERHRLLAQCHDDVFAARSGTVAAGTEVLDLVRGWLDVHHPEVVIPAAPTDEMHPLEAAGRLVQEDLCLMVDRDGGHHLDAACLCFPSHWRLVDKIGRPAAELHGPVPGYEVELAERVDRYLARLRPGVIGRRRNWSVHDSPALFAPVAPERSVPVAAAEVAERLWLRSERQTLRRLPVTGAVLFTIRVQQAPLAVLARRPDVAVRLAARIRAQPAERTAYVPSLHANARAVCDWLDAIGGVRSG